MRLAWFGPPPALDFGVPQVGLLNLRELARLGVSIDAFVAARPEEIPEELLCEPGIRWVFQPPVTPSARWYARHAVSAYVAHLAGRAVAQGRLADAAARTHEATPYDLVYQFSQLELFGLRRLRHRLPPIVLHPEVHAAGELRWHGRETSLSRRSEPAYRRRAVGALLRVRARTQRRDIALAQLVVAPSAAFARDLRADYGVDERRVAVVVNPVDLERFVPAQRAADGPRRVLFVSRFAVRKGVEMVVALSHRLADLAGEVELIVAGHGSAWSDYSPLLEDLHPDVATLRGWVPPADLAELYRTVDLVVQPSHYEPFAISVAEALASGVPVIASDAVGAAEQVDPSVCATFPAGSLDAFEAAVRSALRCPRGPSALARAEAARLFSPEHVALALERALTKAVVQR